MFDFRYHVASLAAVFLAIVLGIVVGVAISDPGLADRAENRRLREQVDALTARLAAETTRSRDEQAASGFAREAYPALIAGRLDGIRVGVVAIGAPDETVRGSIERTIRDAGGSLVRLQAVRVPVDVDAVTRALAGLARTETYDAGELANLGRDLAREFVVGGEAPLWDALATELAEERTGRFDAPVDAVVLVRAVPPQQAETARFLRGLYGGLAGATTVVGAESRTAATSVVPFFRRLDLPVVDAVDTPAGRVALAVLLTGGQVGHYGVKDGADAFVPPIEPLPRAATSG